MQTAELDLFFVWIQTINFVDVILLVDAKSIDVIILVDSKTLGLSLLII